MSALLFVQICALILVTTILCTAVSLAIIYFAMKLMPAYTKRLLEDMENDEDLDEDLDAHFGSTPDPKFYHPEN